jgi:hypothetical protein
LNLLLINELKKWELFNKTDHFDIGKFTTDLKPIPLSIFNQMESDIQGFPKEFIQRLKNLE